ncbi:lysophospholipid acyltransferase family protein [Enterovibrio paralichthyis]|uniref:lysophospholipid acyltransferase family protein n=1 Tax=Enterovibrio paralichthyis TaxID=2853805 RepID=UPI001C489B30|nr:lysophospholipid acyltransferase family protein [Enterovibrio paralichthyis]MBV7297226.1 lysophospholipid acyltransferase family protein [Enterovibrio paralichthyis]
MAVSPFQIPRKTPFGVVEKALESVTGLRALDTYYRRRPEGIDTDDFLKYTLDVLGIAYTVPEEQLANVPKTGGTVVVANHPLGGVEGVILAKVLRQIRPDVKVLANYYLKRIPELSDLFIGVDVFEGESAQRANMRALREAHQHVSEGGLLLIFPAGEVSTFDHKGMLSDKAWSRSAAVLVKKHKATVVPVFIGGQNSRKFYRAGRIHPLLRTALLGRELLNKKGRSIPLSIGDPIAWKEYRGFDNDEALVNYLRLNTYLLNEDKSQASSVMAHPGAALIAAKSPEAIEAELDTLPEQAKLLSSGEFDVYCCGKSDIPVIIEEIGRMREMNFRAVGEGTGLECDLDQYDEYYLHLFIWDREQRQMVGAYRLGRVKDIVGQHGISGLYSRSLFQYDQRFVDSMGASLEMGRSVIDEKYQRSLSALLLLWKGIAEYVRINPEITTLFGPVSISNDYPQKARRLLAESLSVHHYDTQIAALVKPTTPLESSEPVPWHTSMLSALGDMHMLSRVLGRMTHGLGVPVLLRQYLGLNGKLVCFNVDPAFNDALDGLIVVDLRNVTAKTLGRYMGKEQAENYLAHHGVK